MSHNAAPELIDAPAGEEIASPALRSDPSTDPAAPAVTTEPPARSVGESKRARARRMAHRTRLHLYALSALVLLVYVVALATTNTHRVRVDWVFAHSTVPLVWLTLFAAIIGWLLGTLITMVFRLRTRAPRASTAVTAPAPAPPAEPSDPR